MPDTPRVQMNVRLPAPLRDQIDARRATIGKTGISRDEWVRRAVTWVLAQDTRTSGPAGLAQTTTGRTHIRRPR